MTSLSFPDVNVWLAVLMADHMHRAATRKWWESDAPAVIAFSRFTQISVLRLLTTAAAMNGKPLTMSAAWHAYDRLFEDERVAMLPEPDSLEPAFRNLSRSRLASPSLGRRLCRRIRCAEQWNSGHLRSRAGEEGSQLSSSQLKERGAFAGSGALALTEHGQPRVVDLAGNEAPLLLHRD